MEITEEIRQELEAVIQDAYRVSADVGQDVEEILLDGRERPLSRDEASRLLTRVITVLKRSAKLRGDETASAALEGDIKEIVEQVIQLRERVIHGVPSPTVRPTKLELMEYNRVKPGPVLPSPMFHGKVVHMNTGFVKTNDIELWSGNERLEIHLGQFQHKYGRKPTSEELLDLMLSKMELPGLTAEDNFKIVNLARSIAINGVQKPPILDTDGTLLDGNRRVAACHYLMNSDEFDSEQKKMAEYLFVWMLTEHATPDDRDAVVVALNFEPDHKQEWPEYIKARKVYEEWQSMLALEPRPPSPSSTKQAQMKRGLSENFALGPNTTTVNRYLKMVDWANEFEDHHINLRRKDLYEVKHRTNDCFQYFDELAKGKTPGGVAWSLNQDEGFKQLVFDLLFEGKFKAWREIRELKFIYDNQEAREALARARGESDPEIASDHLENAMSIARTRRAESRELGANTRIESFVKWLEELPVRAFRDVIQRDNLMRLRDALRLVEKKVAAILGEEGGEA